MDNITGYTILDTLSSNKTSSTYRAIRNTDNQKVIIKVGELIALQHEYRLFKQIKSNLFITPLEMKKIDSASVIEFKNVPGITFDEYLKNHVYEVEPFLNVAIQIVDIMGILHKHHLIHKDINPSNFLINPDKQTIKLINLSAATSLSEEAQEPINIEDVQGSLAFTSPEQTGRMNRPIDYRTDFYSLGVMFFLMLTGHLPFETDDKLELIYYQIAKPPPNISKLNKKIPTIIAAMVAKLLAKMPEDRYASPTGLKADLNQCLTEWETHQKISKFILGAKDVNDQLQISHHLYGREAEVKQLLSAFDQVSHGDVEMILIAGYSGIGKTSLVKEIHKPIVGQHGYFIQGKFDQLQRSIPFSALVTAFKSLVRQVLSETNVQINKLRQDLKAALGDLGQVVIDVIPEVELIIGKQLHPPKLNPAEAVHRFNLVFQKFVRIFAQPEHPLIIFLDDLQWVDSASLKLIENLLTDVDTHHMLIIGAYRDNEVDSTHPLITTTNSLQKNKVNISTLVLQPLQLNDVQHLIADSLKLPIIKVSPLVELIYEKTHGNPFFINEFVKALYHKSLLSFSYELGQWTWDLEVIKKQELMDNVIDILTMKIHQLSSGTQEILKLAAVIGHEFSLQTLAIVSEQNLLVSARQLWEAIETNLVVPLENPAKTLALVETQEELLNYIEEQLNYRFAHDRIQQANYQLIPEETRQEYHLKVARLLLKQFPLKENSTQLFEIMDHFNQAIPLISSKKEKLKLAEYNLWAGEKAKLATAYQAAKNYFTAGIEFMKPLDWKNNYKLCFLLAKELAAAKFLTAEFNEAQKDFDELQKRATNILDQVEIYKLNIQMLSILNKHREAILLGLKALRLLKISLPENANTFHILKAILKIKTQLRWRSPSKVFLRPMQKPEHIAAADLITQLLNNAFISDQKLFILLASIDVSYSLRYGYTDSTSMACLVYAFTLMHALNLFKEGFAFVDLYSNLRDTYGEGIFIGKNYLVLGTFIDPWRYPGIKCLETLKKGQRVAFDVGDIIYSNYCNVVGTLTAYLIGRPIDEIKDIIKNTLVFMEKAKISDFRHIAMFNKYALKCLTTSNTFSLKKIAQFEKNILEHENKTGINFFYSLYTKLCYLLGYYKEAQLAALKHKKFAEFALGILSNFETKFYYAMSTLALYNKIPANKRPATLRQVYKIRNYVRESAERCPINFQFYLDLLDAKLARIENDSIRSMELYQMALKSASESNVLHLVGIANEALGRLFRDLNFEQFSNTYFSNAYISYKNWGAFTKCKQLEEEYPEILSILRQENILPVKIDESKTNLMPSIDMLAIMKATQTISGEIYLEDLLKKLLTIVLQVSGAERAVILIKNKFDQWAIQAEGDLQKQKIYHYKFEEEAGNDNTDFPVSLVNYVQRTQKPIIVTQQSPTDLTHNDPYILKNQPKSILVMPLMYQGKLRRQLFLENRHSSDVFTQEQIQGLQFLASQAVISLENAYLYHQATHDPLTQLANRSMLYQVFQRYSTEALKRNSKIAILFFDFDYFKVINDALGHELGDKLLHHLAHEFRKCVREGDLVSRLGGDEFVVMLMEITESQEIINVANKIYEKLSNPIHLDDHDFVISASMGISIFPDDGKDIETLLKHADTAMYTAKDSGRNQYRFYSLELEAQHQETHMLTIELQRALERNEFCMYYQPIFNARGKKSVIGLEALLRWQHPARGLLTADKFIPAMEKSLLIKPVGEWIIRDVVQQIKKWRDEKILSVPVAINLSGVQFKNQKIADSVSQILKDTKLDPKFLEFELTETTLIEHNELVLRESNKLQKLGVNFILDDFGTGYSNLSYLKQLPISKLKIDRSFVLDYLNPQSTTLIEAIVAMSHQLDLKVIAEGVETKKQLDFILSFDVDGLQGFYLSLPLPAEECAEFLREQKSIV